MGKKVKKQSIEYFTISNENKLEFISKNKEVPNFFNVVVYSGHPIPGMVFFSCCGQQ